MDQASHQTWAPDLNMDANMSEDIDFNSLVDLGEITLDPLSNDVSIDNIRLMQQSTTSNDPLDTMVSDSVPWPHEDVQMQPYEQLPTYHPIQPGPPTPQSCPMNPADNQVDTRHPEKQIFHNGHAPLNLFTPLASPAVHPHDTHAAQIYDAMACTDLLSPLSSPALMAQRAEHIRQRSLDRALRVMQSNLQIAAPRTEATSHRQKRKSVALSQNNSHELLASSSASATSSSKSPEPHIDSSMGPPPRPGSSYQSPRILAQLNSANAVISRAASNSPATPASLMSFDDERLLAQMSQASPASSIACLPRHDSGLVDFALPPSARPEPKAPTSRVEVFETEDCQQARKTPKINTLDTASSNATRTNSVASSPVTLGMSATKPSPQLSAKTKPSAARLRKSPAMSRSNSKISHSPAVLPRISPAIKPLLPASGPGTTDSHEAMLLASKSNYTKLVEGTLLPGVSYPASLTSSLTVRRTSHKIAEQGRRTRINDAIKDLQALLPVSTRSGISTQSDKDDSLDPTLLEYNQPTTTTSKDKSSNAVNRNRAAAEAKAANSKAATVECATGYIKTLQQEKSILEEALKSRDTEVDALRARVAELETAQT